MTTALYHAARWLAFAAYMIALTVLATS